MAKSILLVYTNCADPKREAEFNEWYDEVHISDVLSVPGFVGCTRYRLAHEQEAGEARYVAIYEMDVDDPGEAMARLREAMPEWLERHRVIDCLKLVSFKTYTYVGP